MIPLKLNLRNFLCYRDGASTLDLEDIRLACLCGENGHGKSALLDAMTWALWGRARGKTQDDLIHYGLDEMMVQLDYLARDTRYRVVRRHSRAPGRRRQGASDLQLQIQAGEDFHAITGNSMRETQAKIDQTTGMDYETFINSALLLQGRADEFTNKTPGERKEVLAKILGLGVFDRFQDRAKARADGKRVAAAVVEADLERMRREVSRRDGYSSELETLAQELRDVDGRLETSKHTLDALKARVDDLKRVRSELEEMARRIPSTEQDIAHLQGEMDSRRRRTATYEELISDKAAIEEGLAQLQGRRQHYEQLNSARETFDRLSKRNSDLERTVDTAKVRLEEQLKELERRSETELLPRAQSAPSVTGKLEQARTRVEELAKEEQGIADQRRHVQDLATRVGRGKASLEQLTAEGKELRFKLDLVQHSHERARCPLCGTELGRDGCQRLSDTYGVQIEEKRGLYRENESSLRIVEAEKDGLEKEFPVREAALRHSQQESQSALVLLQQQLEDSHKAEAELAKVRQDLLELRRQLQQETYATGQQQELEHLKAQIVALGYDPEGHQRSYDEMQELQPLEERHGRLQEALAHLSEERESLGRVEDMLRRRAEDLSNALARKEDMEGELKALPEWEERLQGSELSHRDLETRRQVLFRRQVELEGELNRVEFLEHEIDEKEPELKALREDQGIYQELVEAFGRRGAQAMLIETVLPRVEEEANALLSRMTDNRMHLKLETQRERRSGRGEPVETLEININDEMGPRSYELFSGGEAFRINLALRIALSKVLAHRRGAPLPTLFIDEGFGTQDASGRERILDVIRAIEGDFEKIIVITHLDELKEAFPARIEVEKKETGSTFSVSYSL